MTTRLPSKNKLQRERNDGAVEPLRLVQANEVHFAEHRKEFFAKLRNICDRDRLVGVVAVRGDGVPVIAEVDVRLVTDDTLAGNARPVSGVESVLHSLPQNMGPVITSMRPGVGACILEKGL